MTYELAKQLKDAGFPRGDQPNTPQPQFYEDAAHEKPIRTPTLSELIAACGNDFIYLARADDGSEWRASGGPILHELVSTGLTPEEAVAKLWLALNKK